MVSASVLLLVMFSTFLVLFAYNWLLVPYMTLVRFRRQGVYGPAFVPLLGQIKEFFKWENGGNRLGLLLKYTLTYGRVYAITLGPFVQLTVNHPGYLADILRIKAQSFEKGSISHKYLAAILGPKNLVIEEGEVHAKHRSMINPAFNHANLMDMVKIMTAETKDHIQQWFKQSNDQSANLMELNKALSNMTLDIITVCAFGSGFRAIPDFKQILHQGFTRNEQNVQFRTRWLVSMFPLISELPICRKPEIDSTRARLQGMVDQVISERKAARQSESRTGKQDLLDLLLEARDASGMGFSDEEVRDESCTFVFAGHETTAQTLTWTLFALMSRPHVWAAVVEEVDRVCGPNAQPTWEQLKQLKVCEAVLQESMRLYSPASTIARQSIEDVTVTGKNLPDLVIPANTMLTIDLAVIHRDEQFWGPTAGQFDHTRWMGETRPTANSPYMYLPFSAGARNCIGQNFANLEAKIILAMVCQTCQMSLVPGLKMVSEDRAAHTLAITMKPQNGMNVYVQPRTV